MCRRGVGVGELKRGKGKGKGRAEGLRGGDVGPGLFGVEYRSRWPFSVLDALL